MPIIRRKSLKELKNDDIDKKLNELRLELAKERSQIAVGGSPSNIGRVKELRKSIARLLTEKRKRR